MAERPDGARPPRPSRPPREAIGCGRLERRPGPAAILAREGSAWRRGERARCASRGRVPEPARSAAGERERALRWDRDTKLPPEKPRKVRGGSSPQGWESGSVRGVDCRPGVRMGIIAVGRNHPLRVRAQEGGGESSRGGSSELPAVPSSGRWVIEAEQCRIGCWSAPFRFACQGRNRCIRIQYNIGVYDMISVSIISSLLYAKLWNL